MVNLKCSEIGVKLVLCSNFLLARLCFQLPINQQAVVCEQNRVAVQGDRILDEIDEMLNR